jgi:cellobiose phosphorylase
MKNPGPLSGSQGSVLDPIVSIRYMVVLDPEESVKIDIVSGITETRETALNLVRKYQDRRLTNRVFELAWTYSHIILRQINATEADAQLYGRLASSIIFANSSLRAEQSIQIKNRRGQSGLWGYSISGDLPIVLLQIEDPANIRLVRQLVQAHSYWRLKGLAVDLVIWNEDHAGYRQVLQEQILGLVAAGLEASLIDRPGGIFVRASDQISNEDRILFQTVARVIITDKGGSMAQQINRRSLTEVSGKRLVPSRIYKPDNKPELALPRHDLLYYNGIGGFTQDGREYVITTTKTQITPAPWVNVIANQEFGTVISENGNAYTWRENAHEIRLTPWNNDPVTDAGGEAFFIRDEESGHFWSPTPIQIERNNPYVSRHGFGYSIFEHTEDGIHSELCVYVAIDAPIKFSVLKLKNDSGRPRKISVTGYVEWVLGDLRPKSVMHVSTRIDPGSGALFAKNPYSTEFGERVAFFQTDDAYRNLTCDRTEFIGRNGTLRDPAAMYQSRLSGRVGAGLDPCSAFQVSFDLLEGQERETVFRLGAGRNADDAANLVLRFWGYTAARNALEAVWKFWKNTLGTIQVESADPSINVLVNGWLMYQTLACRIWARSGYYQSGGAFGFRDQLQDSMALLHLAPYMVRSNLILFAGRQFKEGDVQHWWHPPSGRGVRTHCSDDYLWLPLSTCRYVLHTGDTGILDETIHFLEGQLVNPNDDSYYDLPARSDEVASLYQHCIRAIQRGLRFGIHGLPLIGTGDWNDGMNLVGNEGKGESVWLGFFLYDVLMQFSKIAKLHNDQQFADQCLKEATSLRGNIEKNCWDGEWYLRAWFDNGTPLGSKSNPECRIDSISQSWSVLSGAGDKSRSRIAMESVYKNLVRKDQSLVRLLDPPFDKSDLNPGYIKGYVPGVRENGGQYTHAAIWAAMAFAKSGDIKRAWELFEIINPVNHSKSEEDLSIYKAEPYVVAADVYGVSPHTGRGGWTWYTGSAGWMYRLLIESLLGIRVEVNKLYIEPTADTSLKNFTIHYRFRESVYHISVLLNDDSTSQTRTVVDGIVSEEKGITLLDDSNEHFAEIFISNES